MPASKDHILALVGTRDVQIQRADGGRDLLSPPRARGEEVLAELASRRAGLCAPILDPLIQFVLETGTGRIGRVALFVTDQDPEHASPKHRESDTIALGKILKEILASRHGGRIERVTVGTLPPDPHLIDPMLEHFRRVLPTVVRSDALEPDARVWVSTTAGIGAANMGLLLAALETYDARCVPIHVSDTADVSPLHVGRLLRDRQRRTIAASLVEAYDFSAAALALGSDSGGTSDDERVVAALCEALAARLEFDFGRARVRLQSVAIEVPISSALRPVHQRLLGELKQLEQGADPRASLAELVESLRVKSARREWSDFLARTFRLSEGSLRYVLERDGGFDLDRGKDRNAKFPAWRRALATVPGLAEGLASGGIRDPDTPTRPVALATLVHLARGGPAASGVPLDEAVRVKLEGAARAIRRLEKLADLRNRSIVAHDFRGLAAEDLTTAAGGPPLERIEALAAALELPADHPIDRYRTELIRLLTG